MIIRRLKPVARTIELELWPWERRVLTKWLHLPELKSALAPIASSNKVESITIDAVTLHWMACDLTHAIVKQGCRDEDAFALSERLDYADDTGDGSLDRWY